MTDEQPWPSELRVSRDRRQLSVSFNTGETFALTAEMLRVLSPSAEVQGHAPDQRITVGGKRNVEIMQMNAVGNYAVRIVFDDMHDTGIYSWAYLLELGRDKDEKWAAHLAELEEKGLER